MTKTIKKEELVLAAINVSKQAHAPYSNYRVGAAIVSKNGKVFTGCNVENAAYPSGICAERVAIFKAVSEGEKDFSLLAIVTKNGGMPCGACRQVMSEFSNNLPIIVSNDKGEITQETTLDLLLPHSFGANDVS